MGYNIPALEKLIDEFSQNAVSRHKIGGKNGILCARA